MSGYPSGTPSLKIPGTETNARRLPSVAVLRVEVRMYRRSRTASSVLREPPHFEYIVRWTWTGRAAHSEKSPTSKSTVSPSKRGYWWDSLPPSYEVRRRWIDVSKFHEALADLAYDRQLDCRRTRTRLPEFPDRGDLDAFLQAVAATGDSRVLSRKNFAETTDCEELSQLHAIYVENRLAPYFTEVSNILCELPADVLQQAAVVQRFATGGANLSLRARPGPIGPRSLLLSPDELTAVTESMKRSSSLPLLPSFSRQTTDAEQEENSPVSGASLSAMSSPMARRGMASPLGANSVGVNFSDQSEDDDSSPVAGATRTSSPEVRMASAQARARSRERAAERKRERRRRLDLSHYSFFARQVPKEACGRPSTRQFWHQMVVKERRELARRTMLASTGEADEVDSMGQRRASAVTFADPPRLSSLPPSKMSSTSSTPRSSSTWTSAHSRSLDRLPSLKSSIKPNPANEILLRASQIEAARAEICEGLRVMILRMKPLQIARRDRKKMDMNVFMQDHRLGSKQETLTIYKTYRRLLKMDGHAEEADAEGSSGDEDVPSMPVVPEEVMADIQMKMAETNRSGRGGFAQASLASKDLLPITWPTTFLWIQREIDWAKDSQVKSVCKTLLRALKVWREYQATPAQSYLGVSLNMLLQWLWPCATYDDLAQMLTWICHHEMEKIRQPSPKVLHAQDQRQLEGIFKSMDGKGRGFLTAEDIAGGDNQDLETQLRNIVDPDIVKAVCGEHCHVNPTEFLELMCEDNYRAHEGATRVMLADGRKIVEVEREVTGFRGWLLEEVPKCEERRRRTVELLESEVSRYRYLANHRRSVLHEGKAGLADVKGTHALRGLLDTDGFLGHRRRSREQE